MTKINKIYCSQKVWYGNNRGISMEIVVRINLQPQSQFSNKYKPCFRLMRMAFYTNICHVPLLSPTPLSANYWLELPNLSFYTEIGSGVQNTWILWLVTLSEMHCGPFDTEWWARPIKDFWQAGRFKLSIHFNDLSNYYKLIWIITTTRTSKFNKLVYVRHKMQAIDMRLLLRNLVYF